MELRSKNVSPNFERKVGRLVEGILLYGSCASTGVVYCIRANSCNRRKNGLRETSLRIDESTVKVYRFYCFINVYSIVYIHSRLDIWV